MTSTYRQVFVISDLHLGGASDEKNPDKRGFRLFTHPDKLASFIGALSRKSAKVELVINGDLIDFLAERDITEGGQPGNWSSLKLEPKMALRVFQKIAAAEKEVFRALSEFLSKGHRLVLLLGNHDIELSFPLVRHELERTLHAAGRDFHFLYDGEAYAIGDILIEHGNRYDNFNQTDYDALRRNRSLQSRNQDIPPKYQLSASPGSEMVASVINPIKKDYGFINLLKPENEALFPVLLALVPSCRQSLLKVAKLAYEASRHGMEGPTLPRIGAEIASTGRSTLRGVGADLESRLPSFRATPRDELEQALEKMLGQEQLFAFLKALDEPNAETAMIGKDISSIWQGLDRANDLFQLFILPSRAKLEKRLPALLKALQVLQNDHTFEHSFEPPGPYRNAAENLAGRGFSTILFGHTHLARHIDMGSGHHYLNTGTWADYIRFPADIISKPQAEALVSLAAFVDSLQQGNYAQWLVFEPIFARLELNGQDNLQNAGLFEFDDPASV